MQPVLNPRPPDERLSVCIMGEARSFEENKVPSHGRIIDAVRIRSTTLGTIWYGRAKYRYHVLTGEVARRVRELVRQKCKRLFENP